jgi:hypothetical protein
VPDDGEALRQHRAILSRVRLAHHRSAHARRNSLPEVGLRSQAAVREHIRFGAAGSVELANSNVVDNRQFPHWRSLRMGFEFNRTSGPSFAHECLSTIALGIVKE